jgi:quercetin dioxygenase-like cupin family protein
MSSESHAAINHPNQNPYLSKTQQGRNASPPSPDPLLVQWGRLSGVRYDFKKAGYVLPRHQHSHMNNHVVIVQLGSCIVREFENGEAIEYTVKAGDTLDSDAPVDHEIEALEDNTRILNLIK